MSPSNVCIGSASIKLSVRSIPVVSAVYSWPKDKRSPAAPHSCAWAIYSSRVICLLRPLVTEKEKIGLFEAMRTGDG